jgi:hypothetical protein
MPFSGGVTNGESIPSLARRSHAGRAASFAGKALALAQDPRQGLSPPHGPYREGRTAAPRRTLPRTVRSGRDCRLSYAPHSKTLSCFPQILCASESVSRAWRGWLNGCARSGETRPPQWLTREVFLCIEGTEFTLLLCSVRAIPPRSRQRWHPPPASRPAARLLAPTSPRGPARPRFPLTHTTGRLARALKGA